MKNDPERFKGYFFGALQVVAGFVTPVILLIAIFSDEVVALWLGPQWMECAPLFRLLSLAALLGAFSNPVGWFLISLDLTKRYRQIGMFSAAVIVTAFALGLSFGPRGVAVAYSSALCLITVPVWAWALRGTGIRLQEVLSTLACPLAAGAMASLLTLTALKFAGQTMHGIIALFVGASVFCALYAFALLVVFRKWHAFLNLVRTGRPLDIPMPALFKWGRNPRE